MKRFLGLIMGLFLCVSCLYACDKERSEDISNNVKDYFVYPIEDFTGRFEVDDKGNLYFTMKEASDRTFSYINIDGEKVESPIMETILYSVDVSGNILKSYNLGEMAINEFTIDQSKVYYTTSEQVGCSENESEEDHMDHDSIIGYYEYSLENQSVNKLYEHTSLTRIDEMKVVQGKIYYMGIDNKRLNKEFTLAADEDYYYSGEVFGMIDIATGNATELPIDFPVAFSLTLDNNLLIYAHDGDGGYYFTEYDTKEGTLADEIYKDLGKMYRFGTYNEENDIIYNSLYTSTPNLSATTIDSENSTIELMPYVGVSSIVCRGDYTYYTNARKSNQIERIRHGDYIRGDKTIHMISSMGSPYTPFGCGYTITREYPDEERFALSVLSQDNNFDVYLMSSRQSISDNIRDKGSFYPLNEVDGVKEYLDACFPYIKEAATTQEGDIWMLPISVDIPVLLYNESLCKENGIDFTEAIEFEAFIDTMKALRQRKKQEVDNWYNVSGFLLTEDVFHQYIREFVKFNHEDFKELASLLKEEVNYLKDDEVKVSAPIVMEMLEKGNTDHLLFDIQYYYDMQLRNVLNNNIRASELPHITSDKSNIATCIYLCVNPASKNLKSVLNYISSLCDYTLKLNNIMIFKDRERYPDGQAFDDIYNIYQNGDIQYTMPDELFIKDYEKFLLDEMDITTFISETNRKIDTYRKE